MEFNKDNSQYLKIGKWLKVSATVEKGTVRKNMEDRIMISDFPFNTKHYYIFLLLDGHGGSEVADYVFSNFTTCFGKNLIITNGKRLRECITETFCQLDDDVKHLSSGTTASLLLIVTRDDKTKVPEFWVANVGDSTIYGIVKNNKKKEKKQYVKKLSVDHKPDLPNEISRMEKHPDFKEVSEGYVSNHEGSMLAISRALGDSDFGEAVTPVPTIKRIKKPYDIYVVASDGIWDVMNGKQVWNMLNNPKELKAWKYSAGRLNHIRNQKYAQHDNTSLILLFVDLEKYILNVHVEVDKGGIDGRDGHDSSSVPVLKATPEIKT
jgi:serine/threonine protein phosphatase PrpC